MGRGGQSPPRPFREPRRNANVGDLVKSQTAFGTRLGRSLVGLFLVLAVGAVFGIAARQASAYGTYEHGGITTCAVCHQDGHTDRKPVNEVCNTCHPIYRVPSDSTTCWTCHTPGQDMSGFRNDAACTSVCHLPDGTNSYHAGHADRSATCSTCHPLTASLTDPGGSPHHTRRQPPAPLVASFVPVAAAVGNPVTLTGTGFIGAYAVSFNGTPATEFTVISGTQITAIVPVGATSGPIDVATPSGTGTSATSLDIITVVIAKVTLKVGTTSVALGRTMRLTGALTPVSIAESRVDLTVKFRTSGGWRTAGIGFATTASSGAYAWVYRPLRRGHYRVRATLAETAAHTAAHSRWAAFTVR